MSLALELYRPEKIRLFDKRAANSIRLPDMIREENTDLHLFRRFIEGDAAAFTALYKLHNQRLFNYCAKLLGDHEAAKDIAHTVWERIIERKDELRNVENPIGFFYRTAKNLCLDHLKHHKYQTKLDDASDLIQERTSDDEELVLHALEQLSDETKEILILHYYSGYSFEEIAEILGKNSNAIWTKASRARKQLKEIIESELSKGRAQ
jgi:RNA polymerase sigma factor (sigma-70 family)